MKKTFLAALLMVAGLLAARVWQEIPAGAQDGAGAGVRAPSRNGDVNCDGQLDLSDPVLLLNFLFLGTREPCAFALPPDLEMRVSNLEAAVRALQKQAPGGDPVAAALASLSEILGLPQFEFPSHSPQSLACGAGQPSPASLVVSGAALGEVQGFIGEEEVSGLSRFLILLRTSAPSLNPDAQLGGLAALVLRHHGRIAEFRGAISSFALAAASASGALYVAEMVPSAAPLSRNKDSRIFQGQSTREIVEQVLRRAGVRFTSRLEATHPLRDLVVQYNESDFNFASRHLEEEGIFYFFEHGASGDTLVLADSNAAFQPAPGSPYTYYGHVAPAREPGEEHLQTLKRESNLATGKVVLWDHNFESPATPLMGSAEEPQPVPENYEYGTDHGPPPSTPAELDVRAAIRLAALRACRSTLTGTSTAADFKAGQRFTVADRAGGGFSGNYYLTQVQHVFIHVESEACFRYGNSFTAKPLAQPYRPPRRTPRPVVPGVQTAVVTGPPGEEIHTDTFGRVKVRFHWDRTGPTDDASSVWIRVAQPHGYFALPKVGQEVIVAFEQGDIRRPYVLGGVFNGADVPPVELPAEKDVTVLESSRRLDVRTPLGRISGRLESLSDAGPAAPVRPGERSRDNAIVAWACVLADGRVASELGVATVQRRDCGEYLVVLDGGGSAANTLIPIAVGTQGRTASVQQETQNQFSVFTYEQRTGVCMDSAFYFLATAR